MKSQEMTMKRTTFGCTLLLVASLHAGDACTSQTKFATPEAASSALLEAFKINDIAKLTQMMGKNSNQWLLSGDPVIDENNRALFVEYYDQRHDLKKDANNRYHLTVGDNAWPFAAPIIACKKQWSFDGHAGSEEILNRRIGKNELDTIQTLLAIVDAQREYAMEDADGNGINDYAQKFLSDEGKKNGLYWKEEGNKQSPLGVMVAAATAQGYKKTTAATPYHGYFFKILTSQGKSADGGAYSYINGDKMIGGFAVLAYPAKYGSSGIMSFMVNHDGVVYQKNIGKKTSSIASAIKHFNPDKSWEKVE
jgi:hypothetical protein